MKKYGRIASDLTSEMIEWVEKETIPRLKEEYGINSQKDYLNADDMDMVWLCQGACSCNFPEFIEDDWNVDEEQVKISLFRYME